MPLRAVASYTVSNVDKVPVEGETSVRLCNYTDVYKNAFIDPTMDFMAGTATAEEIRRFGLRPSDVLITKDSESWDDIGVPALVRDSAPDLVCGYHLAILRPEQSALDGRFLFRCLESKVIRVQLELSANGVTRFGIPKSAIGATTLPVPPLAEQRAIADYLDRETARLDALVAAKERVLGLLAQKRDTLISRAVTKGINASARMKDSGIHWLGPIPEHWSTPPVYARFEVQLGKMLDEKRITGEHLAPYLRNVDVQWGGVNTDDLPQMDFSSEDRRQFSLRPNDILVCEGGEIGRSALWTRGDMECYYQKALHRLRPTTVSDHPQFFVLAMRVMVALGVFSSSASASTIQHLPAEKLRLVRFPCPPLNEQIEIAAYVARETARVDGIVAATERSITLIKERRSALISAAVTGALKIA